MPDDNIILLDKIMIYLIKGLIFTLPLFFLPWTFEWFEFNKFFLLLLIVPIIAILFFIKSAKFGGKLILKNSPMDIPVLIFLLAFYCRPFSALISFLHFLVITEGSAIRL